MDAMVSPIDDSVFRVTMTPSVPKRVQPPQPHWSIADLIDLEFALSRSQEKPGPGFFESEVEPWIEPAEIGHPGRKTMSRALWQWLERERRKAGDGQLPGRAYSGALALVTCAALALTFSIGSGAVLGLLNQYDGRTFHVLALLAVTIGVQWIFLLLSWIGYATWGLWRHHVIVSGAQRLINLWINRLVRRSLGEDAGNWWRETSRTRRLFGFPALVVSQMAGLAFSVGSLIALLGCVLFLSVRFGWETTTAGTVAPAVEQAVQWLAAPWSWIRPEWVPDDEVIRGTLISLEDRRPVMVASQLSARWYPFLLACLLVWGILPRVTMLGIMTFLRHRALNDYSFQERVHREWWRGLTELEIHAATAGPADGAFALLLGGLDEPPGLRRACLQQLRFNVEERAVLGSGSLEDDEMALKKAVDFLSRKKDGRIILVAESWALVPKEFREIHDRLREKVGAKAALDLFLIGLPGPDHSLKPPAEEEISMWEKFAGELGDPFLYIQPFQAALAH